jgi:hypothetical protein
MTHVQLPRSHLLGSTPKAPSDGGLLRLPSQSAEWSVQRGMGGNMTEDRNDVELVILEELEGTIGCEMKHHSTVCSETVTHLAIDCRKDFFVCAVAHATIELMLETNNECAHCGRQAKECWRVVKTS